MQPLIVLIFIEPSSIFGRTHKEFTTETSLKVVAYLRSQTFYSAWLNWNNNCSFNSNRKCRKVLCAQICISSRKKHFPSVNIQCKQCTSGSPAFTYFHEMSDVWHWRKKNGRQKGATKKLMVCYILLLRKQIQKVPYFANFSAIKRPRSQNQWPWKRHKIARWKKLGQLPYNTYTLCRNKKRRKTADLLVCECDCEINSTVCAWLVCCRLFQQRRHTHRCNFFCQCLINY